MEATFPLSPFQREQHFSPAIQITKPFGIFLVLKMRPCITMDFFEPFPTAPILSADDIDLGVPLSVQSVKLRYLLFLSVREVRKVLDRKSTRLNSSH